MKPLLIKKIFYNFLILVTFLNTVFCIDSLIPDQNQKNWTILNNKDIWVGYKYSDDLPWVRSVAELPYSIEKITPLIGNFEIYSNIFLRIIESKVIDSTNNIVYLKIDMPIFNDRDYIVKYKSYEDNTDVIFEWYSIIDEEVPEYDNIVRLKRAAGQWRLTPKSNDVTLISYTWNGELLGNFPNFYLTTAWETQGKEIIEWLSEALNK